MERSTVVSRRLIGIYEAEGSLIGELSYVVGNLFGTRHCALCDITHGGLRKKASVRVLEADVDLTLIHLDERSPAELAASEGRTPCVLVEDQQGLRVLLTAEVLESCEGSVERFESLLREHLSG